MRRLILVYLLRRPWQSGTKKFRLRFRMPFESYLDFVKEAKDNALLKRWTGFDACGKKSSPVELLILGSLEEDGPLMTLKMPQLSAKRCIVPFFHANNSGRSQRTWEGNGNGRVPWSRGFIRRNPHWYGEMLCMVTAVALRRPKLALPKRFFRGRLVENFNILFWDGQVVWPQRTGVEQPFLGYS